MSHEMSIEVVDGEFPASLWAEAHADGLIESALLHGAIDWRFHHLRWGVVLELAFADEEAWERFRAHPAVVATLDIETSALYGLLVYRGWGGSSSPREPRRPRPRAGAGAAALPLPLEDLLLVAPSRPRQLLLR
ncbi:MAG: hypothetical protein ACR2LJ_08350 [Acidimicrobiales bacterium]